MYNHSVLGAAVLLAVFNAGFVQAQVVEAPRNNYFTADHSPSSYLKVLEANHVNTFQARVSKGDMNLVWGDIIYTLDRFANHPQGLQQLSQMAQLLKRNAIAIKYFQMAVDLYPQNAITWVQYGMFLLAINQVDDSIQKLQQAVAVDAKFAPGHAALAHAYVRKKDVEHAREAAMQARDLGFKGQLPAGLP